MMQKPTFITSYKIYYFISLPVLMLNYVSGISTLFVVLLLHIIQLLLILIQYKTMIPQKAS